VPKLRQVKPDAILVMDNLRPHHATEVRELLDQAWNWTAVPAAILTRVQSDILRQAQDEEVWAKVEERLKAKAARTPEALEAELKPVLDPSPQRMPNAGSGTLAMPDTDLKSALAMSYTDPKPALASLIRVDPLRECTISALKGRDCALEIWIKPLSPFQYTPPVPLRSLLCEGISVPIGG
jgi:hypothetical protein